MKRRMNRFIKAGEITHNSPSLCYFKEFLSVLPSADSSAPPGDRASTLPSVSRSTNQKISLDKYRSDRGSKRVRRGMNKNKGK